MKIHVLKWAKPLILLFVIALFGSTVWFCFSPAVPTLSPRESALHQTRQLLSAASQNSIGPMPNDLPGYLRVNEECWKLLQQSMKENSNQYTLAVTNEYDSSNDPNSVHQLIEVWIKIDFPDGQQAEMYYSQGGLTGCREK